MPIDLQDDVKNILYKAAQDKSIMKWHDSIIPAGLIFSFLSV